MEFFDSDIETLKEQLIDQINEFDETIMEHTFHYESDKSAEFNCVPREWQNEQPKRYQETVEKLNNTADMIVELYEKFVRLSKKKLGVIVKPSEDNVHSDHAS